MKDKKVQTKNTTELPKTEKDNKSSQIKSVIKEHRHIIEWYTIPCLLIICYSIYVLPKVIIKMAFELNAFVVAVLILAGFLCALFAILGFVLNKNSKTTGTEKDDLSNISNSYTILKAYTDAKDKKSSDNLKER